MRESRQRYTTRIEREVQAEEMLDIPPEWNEVEDLAWEGGDILEDMRLEKRRRDEISQGRRKRRKEDDIRGRNKYILLRYLGGCGILRDSILKIGMKINRRRMNGRYQTNSRRFHRWCFAKES